MGLFGSKENCSICSQAVKGSKLKVSDGVICSACIDKCAQDVQNKELLLQIGNCSVSDFKKHIEFMETENKKCLQVFKASSGSNDYIKVDFENKLFYLPLKGKRDPFVYSFSDLINYELVEDDTTISKGGLGSAVVGGAIFGAAGMITGGILGKKSKDIVKSMYITLSLNDPLLSYRKIELISTDTKKSGMIYNLCKKAGENTVALLDRICGSVETPVQPQTNISAADEIKKFKELLDSGIITEEEFNAKKKQLLGL